LQQEQALFIRIVFSKLHCTQVVVQQFGHSVFVIAKRTGAP